MSARNSIRVDVAIVGGGIAGLWLLNLLRSRGYGAVLIEREAFGDGQTIRSQGMIHGGLKYALSGSLTAASEALAAMPERWRACLNGSGEVDLRGVRTSSDRGYLWSPDESMLGRLGGFLASKALRGRARRLDAHEHPAPFDRNGFSGVVYELDELVLDTRSLVAQLADAQRGFTMRAEVIAEQFVRADDGSIAALRLPTLDVCAAQYVFAAGTGNEALVAPFGQTAPPMQRRPLRQVIVRHANLPALYGHCVPQLPKTEPRLTVTTHTDPHEKRLWYVGGQLASDGVERSDDEQERHAHAELAACLPWIDLSGAQIESLCVDRAEPRQTGGRRPDEAFVAAVANALICWPTKLALTPDLGDKVLAQLRAPSGASDNGIGDYAAPPVAAAPWDR
jgi:glycine/D-amino acid oxidase-like deaminating enzyme